MAANPIYIPTFIGSITYAPVRVLPHIYFYNGTKDTNTYFIGGYGATTSSLNIVSQSAFPYFDNYSGNTPTTESLSLLFNNEAAVYGEAPTASLYTTYWEKYISLLYNPRTRLINCEGIIPLANYFKMELNDIVEWRGNYYHLRAINDYNLKNGECKIQLLGPILEDVITNLLPEKECGFNFTSSVVSTNTKTLLYEVTQSMSASYTSKSGSLLFNFNDGSNPPVYDVSYYEYVTARNISNGNNLYSGSITLQPGMFTTQSFGISFEPTGSAPFVFADYDYKLYTDNTLILTGSLLNANSLFVSISPSVFFNPISNWSTLKVVLNVIQ